MITPEILTYTGNYFNFENLDRNKISIIDIAKSLSNICRFNGHCEFYSVAQHSVLVSRLVPQEYALKALLHDASEAYLGDVTFPLKQLLPTYKDLEKRVQELIYLNFCYPDDQEGDHKIKEADMIALATEKKVLFPHNTDTWDAIKDVVPLSVIFRPLLPREAEANFLHRFAELTDAQ